MNKIKSLIFHLCPNGVIYKPLGEVACIKNGQDYKHLSKGTIPVYGSGGIMTYVDRAIYNKPTVLIPRKGSLHKLYYTEEAFWNVDTIFYTIINDELIIPKFLYYFLKTQHLENLNNSGGVPSLTQRVLNKIEIPIPQIEIQEQIVQVLDKYTDENIELQAKLQEELQARKEQYEFYLNRLFEGSFDELKARLARKEISAKPLSELGEFIRGKRFVRADIVDEGYPCIHYGDMYTYYGVKATDTKTFLKKDKVNKLRFAEKGDVVIVAAGENKDDIGVGLAWLGESKPAVHDACFIYRHSESLDPMYISYFLRTQVYHSQIHKHVAEAKICAIPSNKIGTAIIPVPSLAEQERIVSILDKYEYLVNELTQELQAEIQAVQEQYEYYRNKLLTFKRKS